MSYCIISPSPTGRVHVVTLRGSWTIRRTLTDWQEAVAYARTKTQDKNIFIR